MQKVINDWQSLGYFDGLLYLLRTGHLADCSFLVGSEGEEFRCHKFVLAHASPVFEKMFYGDFKEKGTAMNVPLEDIIPKEFEMFLTAIYAHSCTQLRFETLTTQLRVHSIADRFMAYHVKAGIVDIIESNVKKNTWSDLIITMAFACEINDTIIWKACAKILDDGIEDEDFWISDVDSKALLDIDADIFFELLKKLAIPEEFRFQLLEKYAEVHGFYDDSITSLPEEDEPFESNKETVVDKDVAQADESTAAEEKPRLMVFKGNSMSRADFLKMMLDSINFQEFSAENFARGPAMSMLLTNTQKMKFQRCINKTLPLTSKKKNYYH